MIINNVEISDEQILEAAEKIKSGDAGARWLPMDLDIYWYIDCNGDIKNSTWSSDDIDKKRLEFFNASKRKSLAESALIHTRIGNALAMAKALIEPGFKVDWNNNEKKFFSFSMGSKACFEGHPTTNNLTPAYPTKELAQKAAQWLIDNGVHEL